MWLSNRAVAVTGLLQVSFRLFFLVLLMHIFYVNFLLVSVVMDQLIDGYFWFLFLHLWALFFFFRKLISSHLIKIRRHCFIWLVAKLSTHQVVKETATVQEQGNETSAFALQSKKHFLRTTKSYKTVSKHASPYRFLMSPPTYTPILFDFFPLG